MIFGSTEFQPTKCSSGAIEAIDEWFGKRVRNSKLTSCPENAVKGFGVFRG
jgi:hypothetical protein